MKDRLKELRTMNEMNISEFSKSIGLKPQTYSAYEKGINKPPIDVLINIATKYKVSLDWICRINRNPKHFSSREKINNFFMTLESGVIEINTEITVSDVQIKKIIERWRKIYPLVMSGELDKEIYEIWKEKEINEIV